MKKLESVQSSPFEKIPSQIIWDILSRLPTKSCLNCKLVCKEWYQIITSLDFIALRSARCPFFTLLLYGNFYGKRKNFLLLDLDRSLKIDETGNVNVGSEAMIMSKSKFNIPQHKMGIVNECNGIVCFESEKRGKPYVICNILTGQEVIVEQVGKPSCTVTVFGLGCCPVSQILKILRLLKMGSFECKAEVCELGRNEWRAVGDAPLHEFHHSKVFLYGSLHRCSYGDNRIWLFHFGSEQFSCFSGPFGMSTNDRTIALSTFESCLSFCITTENHFQFEI